MAAIIEETVRKALANNYNYNGCHVRRPLTTSDDKMAADECR